MKGSYYRTKNSCKVLMSMMESKLSLLPRRCRHREVVRGVWVVVGGIGLYRGWFYCGCFWVGYWWRCSGGVVTVCVVFVVVAVVMVAVVVASW